MTTNFRVLCAQLLAAVEHQHGDPSIDRLALSRRARAALAEGAGVEPTDEELAATALKALESHRYATELPYFLYLDNSEYEPFMPTFRAVLARYGTHPRPIPVAIPVEERPWEREGFCDVEGQCWWWDSIAQVWTCLNREQAERAGYYTYACPAAAIPLPEASP